MFFCRDTKWNGAAVAFLMLCTTVIGSLWSPLVSVASAQQDAPRQDSLQPPDNVPAARDKVTEKLVRPELSGPYALRNPRLRPPLDEAAGVTAESEHAVQKGLLWLVAHQQEDGGWSFDHRLGPCDGRCNMHGRLARARNAATGLSLLALLGAGHTHQQGEHRKAVEQGLDYLIQTMEIDGDRGSLHQPGGTMYGHGMATLAICEAYGMTLDPQLQKPAQAAVNYIVAAQDPTGGGWRYMPRQPGDTSVLGWQVMALRAARLAYLHVPPRTFHQADAFLDSVAADGGASYGYTTAGDGLSTSAIGLLTRHWLGNPPAQEAVRRGTRRLLKSGAWRSDLYFDFFASQLLREKGAESGQRWNSRVRDWLVATQETEEHAAGSWYVPRARWGAMGGRLYCTAMACLILEAPYRACPLDAGLPYEDEQR